LIAGIGKTLAVAVYVVIN